jgi:hypothetical protein
MLIKNLRCLSNNRNKGDGAGSSKKESNRNFQVNSDHASVEYRNVRVSLAINAKVTWL